MSTNIAKRLLELLPQNPVLIGDILSHHEDNTSTVVYPDGSTQRVRGVIVAVGQPAFVRNGVVEQAAPARTAVVIEV